MARVRAFPPSVDPGIARLPPTPPGWKRAAFGDILEVIERPVSLRPDASYKLVTAKRSRGGIVLRGELLGRDILTKTQFEVHPGDFLISRRQIVHGACGVVPSSLSGAVVSNEYAVVRTKAAILMDFLRHYSHTSYFQRTCFQSSHGVAIEKMIFKLDEWLKREIDIPPLPEQRKIAAILSSVDETIEKTEAVIERLDIVKKAMLEELLTRGMPGRHSRFKETEIGVVPEGWELVPLESLLREPIQNGYSPVCPSEANGRWILHLGALTPSGFNSSGVKPAPPDDAKVEQFRVEPGDLLVSRSNTAERVGLAGVYRGTPTPCSYPDLMMRVRLREQICPDFAEIALLSTRAREYFMRMSRGTSGSMKKIDRRVLGAFPIAVPSTAEQSEIVKLAHAITVRNAKEVALLNHLRDAKFSLGSALLSGDIRVSP